MEENKLLTPLEPKPEAIPEELKTLRQLKIGFMILVLYLIYLVVLNIIIS